jgi:hypothetical protein
MPDDSTALPDALYTYDTLRARSDVIVRATGPFAPDWDARASTADNLKVAGCRRVLWRIGDGAADFGDACPDAIVIECGWDVQS